jgi:hypothetical protein
VYEAPYTPDSTMSRECLHGSFPAEIDETNRPGKPLRIGLIVAVAIREHHFEA